MKKEIVISGVALVFAIGIFTTAGLLHFPISTVSLAAAQVDAAFNLVAKNEFVNTPEVRGTVTGRFKSIRKIPGGAEIVVCDLHNKELVVHVKNTNNLSILRPDDEITLHYRWPSESGPKFKAVAADEIAHVKMNPY